jgi:bifunctional DNase/RNase
MTVGGVAPTPEGNAVVLMDEASQIGILIFVGGTEALSIMLRLEHRQYERPLTHDLLDKVLRNLGGAVVNVRVDRLEDDIFYGSVLLDKDGRLMELDARPSDALAVALGNAAPVYVSETVIHEAGVDVDKLDLRRPGKRRGRTQGPDAGAAAPPSGEVAL